MSGSRTKTLAMEKADRYFSKFIRLRDKGQRCITCGKWSDEMDAGHFITRDKQCTRYDEQNVNAQCQECNRFKGGRQYEHGIAIDKKYGAGTAEKLLMKSRMTCKRIKYDFEVIADTYKRKFKELEKTS